MSHSTNVETLLLEADTILKELKKLCSIESVKTTTPTIYSWMDDNSEWWSSFKAIPQKLPQHFQKKIIMENKYWNIKHQNYQEVSQFQKAVKSA